MQTYMHCTLLHVHNTHTQYSQIPGFMCQGGDFTHGALVCMVCIVCIVCTHKCIHTVLHAYTHCMCCMCTHSLHVCAHPHIHAHKHIHTYTHVHTHTSTHLYTHTHTYTQVMVQVGRAYTGPPLRMKTLCTDMMGPAYSPWQMQVRWEVLPCTPHGVYCYHTCTYMFYTATTLVHYRSKYKWESVLPLCTRMPMAQPKTWYAR